MKKVTNMNRSTRRTRAAIRNALLNAIEQKPISSVTVQEIIDNANICRTTFYAHYRDVQDLVKTIGDEIIDEVGEHLSGSRYSEDQGCVYPTIASVVHTYAENAETIRLLNGPNGDPSFNSRMQEKIYSIISDLRRQFDPSHFNELHHRLYSFYVISGGISVMNDLLYNRIEWDPEQLIEVFCSMASHGQKVFQITDIA